MSIDLASLPVQPKTSLSFKHKDKDVSMDDVLYGLDMMESSGGKNVKSRYEPKYHLKLKDKYNKGEWNPTPAERKVILKYGADKALKMFSTSRGRKQILPETAYRYTSFAGEPQDLDKDEVQDSVARELLQRFHKLSGGDLKKTIHFWNQGNNYFPKFKEYLNKDRGLDLSFLNLFSVKRAEAGTSFDFKSLPVQPTKNRPGFQEELDKAMPGVELPGGVKPTPKDKSGVGGDIADYAKRSLANQKQDIVKFGQFFKKIAKFSPRFEQIVPSLLSGKAVVRGFGELLDGLSLPLKTLSRVPTAIQTSVMPLPDKSRAESALKGFLLPEDIPPGYLGGEAAKKMSPHLWVVAGILGTIGEVLSYDISYGHFGKRLSAGYQRAKIKGVEAEINTFVKKNSNAVVKKLEEVDFFPKGWTKADKTGRVESWMKEQIISNPKAGEYLLGKQTPLKVFTRPFKGKAGAAELPAPGKPTPKDLSKLSQVVAGNIPKIKGIVEQAGAKFKAVTDMENSLFEDEPTIYYDDPKGGTHTIRPSQLTVENVKAKFLPDTAPDVEAVKKKIAPKPEQALLGEAKKYKSAEEFVASAKPEPEVFYIKNVEIIKNPSRTEVRQLDKEFRKEFPQGKGEPSTRTTYDEEGNKYIWRADKAVHSDVQAFIKKEFGLEANQNEFLLEKPIKFTGKNTDAIVTKSAKEQGKWQATFLDKKGVPNGDVIRDTYNEAVQEARLTTGVLSGEQINARKEFESLSTKQLTTLWNQAHTEKPVPVAQEPLIEEAKKYDKVEEFVGFMRGSATQYREYNPRLRAKYKIFEDSARISELGIDPEKEVIIYRGVSDAKTQKIVDGDFVTVDRLSAESYAGKEYVVSKKVKAKDLIADSASEFDKNRPFELGAEFIYSDIKNELSFLSDAKLTAVWNQAHAEKPVLPPVEPPVEPPVTTGIPGEPKKQTTQERIKEAKAVTKAKEKAVAAERLAKEKRKGELKLLKEDIKVRDVLTGKSAKQESKMRERYDRLKRQESLGLLKEDIRRRSELTKLREYFKGKEAKQRERKNLSDEVKKMIKFIKDMPTHNLPLEYKDVIEEIKQGVEFGKIRLSNVLKRTKARRALDIDDQLAGKVSDLEKIRADEMTVEELREVYDVVQQLYHSGSIADKFIKAEEQKKLSEAVVEGAKNINKGSIDDLPPYQRHLSKSWKDKPASFKRAYIAAHRRPEALLEQFDGFKEGINYNIGFKPLLKGTERFMSNMSAINQELTNIFEKVKISKILHQRINVDDYSVKLTRDNLMFIYANSLHPQNRAHLEASGVTEGMMKNATKALSEEEKQTVKDVMELMKRLWPRLDKVYSNLKGVHLGKVAENYFPIMNLENVGDLESIEMNIKALEDYTRTGNPQFLKGREKTSQKAYRRFSFFENAHRYTRQAEYYIAMAEALRDSSKYLYHPVIKESIRTSYGEEFNEVIDKWLEDTKRGRYKRGEGIFDRVSAMLRGNFVISVLGGNLSTIIKQPVSFLQGAGYIGKGWAARGVAEFIINPKAAIAFAHSKSVQQKNRKYSQERELEEIMIGRGLARKFNQADFRAIKQLIREGAMFPIVAADHVTTTCLWLGAYHKQMSKGFDEQQAIDYADKVIRRTQPQSGLLHLPDLFRGGPFQKLFTTFRNQPNQNWNLIYDTYAEFGSETKTKESFAKFMTGNFYYILLAGLLFGFVDRKRRQENWKEVALDMANQYTGGMFMLGDVVQKVKYPYGSSSLLGSVYDDAAKIITAKDSKKIKYAGRFGAKVTGVPAYTAIERAILRETLKEKALGGESQKKKDDSNVKRTTVKRKVTTVKSGGARKPTATKPRFNFDALPVQP